MAGGFFLGGLAEGISDAERQALAERTQTEKTGIASRQLDITQQLAQHQISQDIIKRGDELIANTMGTVAETIKTGLAVGNPPEKIAAAVRPLVDSIKPVAARIGRDPTAFDAQVQTMLSGPTGVQVGLAAGAQKGAEVGQTQVTGSQVMTGEPVTAPGAPGGAKPAPAGGKPNITSIILDPKQRADMEKTMADDYRAESKNFVVQRDFKDRMDTAPKTGAGDISLIFSFMKILDPTSTVREGEFATAANAGGAYALLGNLYNKLMQGDKLPDTARDQIKAAAEAAWTKAVGRYNELTAQTDAKAKRYGINPKNVIIDYNPSSTPATGTTTTAPQVSGIPAPPAGFTLVK